MKNKFRLYRRGNGMYYSEDVETGQQASLGTDVLSAAEDLLHAMNQAHRQPSLNLQIARVYLSGADPAIAARTWKEVMEEIARSKPGVTTRRRYEQAYREKAFDVIRDLPVLETNADHLLKVLHAGGVATNGYLRRLHNYAVGMNWLPWSILARKLWPKVEHAEKRAITFDEHRRILKRERNPERRNFYELLWHTGASQSDQAMLVADDIDWNRKELSFERMKVRWRGQHPPVIKIGTECEKLLRRLPRSGPLFPYMRRVRSGDRSTEFKQRCEGLGIIGVTMHSYRYAWAERANKAGYPERYAQQALGHNSKAVHRAYSRRARVVVPSLEVYEAAADGKIIPLDLQLGKSPEDVPKARMN